MKPKTFIIIAFCIVFIAFAIALYQNKHADHALAENNTPTAPQARLSHRHDETRDAATAQARKAKEQHDRQVQIEHNNRVSHWTRNASSSLTLSKNHIIDDLKLTPEEIAALDQIFASREAELAKLLSIQAEGDGNDIVTMKKICGLLRNKGLREDLAVILPSHKLATFDANEAIRVRDTNEARAYRDMAEINEVVILTETQKTKVLESLIKEAATKVEHEADTRAFMTLEFGQVLNNIDPSSIRGIANIINTGINQNTPPPEYGSDDYQKWAQQNKTLRINKEISVLEAILNPTQLTRYRQHMESELAW